MPTVQLEPSLSDDGYWVKWSEHDGEPGHGRVGSSPLTEHEALELIQAMHDDLTKAGFKMERAPEPAVIIVHATVEDIERVTSRVLR